MSDYEERLTAPLRVWLGALVLALLLAGGIHAGGSGPRAVVPYVLLPTVALLVLAQLSRGRVRVADGVLHVPGARIPVALLADPVALDPEGTRQLRGPLAEPGAHVATRPWLSSSVRVRVVDPGDDTPYWLVGTRDPEALVRALGARRG